MHDRALHEDPDDRAKVVAAVKAGKPWKGLPYIESSQWVGSCSRCGGEVIADTRDPVPTDNPFASLTRRAHTCAKCGAIRTDYTVQTRKRTKGD